jgi:hypothetical protein
MQMRAHRAQADAQLIRNFFVKESFGKEAEDF